ncbi:DUF3558 domain-containing protein [Streptomyces kanamyceticus]|uniref:DUF3558 domain-containing protein n=1 Tax=Streptomyces kanamyceticus TaxID=1967 RepID=A0A5J6GFD7_STRKN|nr:DUF3558 domain-containing protein [Streptomyces kanamyceticus]QEU92641.1 DUF3558 domain-containing protein [Streptomyces kanamyceticus]
MQRKAKACVPGVAALLAALLAGCSGGDGLGDGADDSKPGDTGSSSAPAQPGKYRTLPEPCGEVDSGTLDSMLPGIKEMAQEEQREKAYEGKPTVTYDTDRRVGCNWKVESAGASHHLLVDFERVVSYDGAVSDDERAAALYARKLEEAGLPEPSSTTESEESTGQPTDDPSAGSEAGDKPQGSNADDPVPSDKSSKDGKGSKDEKGKKGKAGADGGVGGVSDGTSQPTDPPPGLEPRTLDDLGDEAFIDDTLTTATSATRHRTVTVVFRTSNVIVTIEYDEQPGRRTDVPDSKEMQDKTRELADSLSGKFDE